MFPSNLLSQRLTSFECMQHVFVMHQKNINNNDLCYWLICRHNGNGTNSGWNETQCRLLLLFFYLFRTLSAIWCDSADGNPGIWKQNDLTDIHRTWNNMRVLNVTLRLCWKKSNSVKWHHSVYSMKKGTKIDKVRSDERHRRENSLQS